MSKDKPLWILGCERCKIFIEAKTPGKLIYPDDKNKIQTAEYVIYEGEDGSACVVFRDHLDLVTRESWGRMLYIVKTIYGGRIRVKYNRRETGEHFICHINKN